MTNETSASVVRRTVLKASAVTVGALGTITSATADDHESEQRTEDEGGEVDEPEGFSAEVLAPHANFVDDVTVGASVIHEAGDEDATIARDASNVVFVKATFEPKGTLGWHTHPGPAIVNVAEGQLEVIYGDDCVRRTYSAGEAFIDVGVHDEIVTNPSETEQTVLYVTFLEVPDGENPTEWVKPPDC